MKAPSGINPVANRPAPVQDDAVLLMAMRFDSHRLFLPQREIRSLESVLDIQRHAAPPPVAGVIALAGETWPVYCLEGQDLVVRSELPAQRRVCLLLDDGQHRMAFVCDQIETLARPPRLYPLPPCMAKPKGLIDHLVVEDEHSVGCMVTTARLMAFCQRSRGRGGRNG